MAISRCGSSKGSEGDPNESFVKKGSLPTVQQHSEERPQGICDDIRHARVSRWKVGLQDFNRETDCCSQCDGDQCWVDSFVLPWLGMHRRRNQAGMKPPILISTFFQ